MEKYQFEDYSTIVLSYIEELSKMERNILQITTSEGTITLLKIQNKMKKNNISNTIESPSTSKTELNINKRKREESTEEVRENIKKKRGTNTTNLPIIKNNPRKRKTKNLISDLYENSTAEKKRK